MSASRAVRPLVGVGLGLRWEFAEALLAAGEGDLGIDFFEVSPENYLGRGGWVREVLRQVASRWPVTTHGLTGGFGGLQPPAEEYVSALAQELSALDPPFHSDHLCLTRVGGRQLHELLPLPFTSASARRAAEQVRALRDRLERPVAVENVTWYAHAGRPELGEAAWLGEVLERSDAPLLLDVNNVYVNAMNHGFDALEFLRSLPLERVVEVHVAGHTVRPDGFRIDTHGAEVADPVLDLLAWVLRRTGPVAVLLERDHEVPSLDALREELCRLRRVVDRALASPVPGAAA